MEFEENRIFVEFNENLFNFNHLEQEEKFFQLDLLSGEPKSQIDQRDNQDEDERMGNIDSEIGSNDLITVNYFPVSLSHCNLVLNYDKNCCQVLSNEIIGQALEIFNLSKKNNLKLGYNSLGAGCIINHLHFELIWTSEDNPKLAIESSLSKALFSTNLEYLSEPNEDDCDINVVRRLLLYIKTSSSLIITTIAFYIYLFLFFVLV